MAEYIKKEDALKEVVRFSTEEGSNTVCSKLYSDIGFMPTTDIVYCKECKHRVKHKLYGEIPTENWCEMHRKITADKDWFCADGERRDNNG